MKFRARRVAHFRADHHAIVFTCQLGDASIERLIVGLGISYEDWQEFGLVVNLGLASQEPLGLREVILIIHRKQADSYTVRVLAQFSSDFVP